MIFHLFIISSAVQIYEFSYIDYHYLTISLHVIKGKLPYGLMIGLQPFLKTIEQTTEQYENDVLFSNDTGILGKRNSEFSQQESNLRPSDC